MVNVPKVRLLLCSCRDRGHGPPVACFSQRSTQLSHLHLSYLRSERLSAPARSAENTQCTRCAVLLLLPYHAVLFCTMFAHMRHVNRGSAERRCPSTSRARRPALHRASDGTIASSRAMAVRRSPFSTRRYVMTCIPLHPGSREFCASAVARSYLPTYYVTTGKDNKEDHAAT